MLAVSYKSPKHMLYIHFLDGKGFVGDSQAKAITLWYMGPIKQDFTVYTFMNVPNCLGAQQLYNVGNLDLFRFALKWYIIGVRRLNKRNKLMGVPLFVANHTSTVMSHNNRLSVSQYAQSDKWRCYSQFSLIQKNNPWLFYPVSWLRTGNTAGSKNWGSHPKL